MLKKQNTLFDMQEICVGNKINMPNWSITCIGVWRTYIADIWRQFVVVSIKQKINTQTLDQKL